MSDSQTKIVFTFARATVDNLATSQMKLAVLVTGHNDLFV